MTTDFSQQAIPAVKAAETEGVQGLIPVIKNRWSPRAFEARTVAPETLKTLLEAARWAASCFNEQPWRYIVGVRGEGDTYEKLLGVLVEKNQAWAKAAPVLMLSVARQTFTHNNKPNRFGMHDVGAASALIAIQAAAMGLELHQMGGFDIEKARQVFGIPNEYEPAAAIAVGYPGPPELAPPDFQAGERAPRTRKPLADMVFGSTWGKTCL